MCPQIFSVVFSLDCGLASRLESGASLLLELLLKQRLECGVVNGRNCKKISHRFDSEKGEELKKEYIIFKLFFLHFRYLQSCMTSFKKMLQEENLTYPPHFLFSHFLCLVAILLLLPRTFEAPPQFLLICSPQQPHCSNFRPDLVCTLQVHISKHHRRWIYLFFFKKIGSHISLAVEM